VDFDSLFRALADPTRRRLLDALLERDGQTLFELMGRLLSWREDAPSRQAVSKHLGVLEEVGLVRVEWRWRSKHHFLEREPLRRLMKIWLGPLAAEPVKEKYVEDHSDERVSG
jgi:DNA-binding transcriptional ArsR family regulator